MSKNDVPGLAACPDAGELVDFSLGKLGWERLEEVAHHTANCPVCSRRLGQLLDVSDPLVAALRRPAVDDPYSQEPECGAAQALLNRGIPGAQAKRRPGTAGPGFA